MSEQLSYEEAMIAAVLWSRGGENYEQSIAAARASMDAISSAPRGLLFDIRAALARGPQGKADAPVENVDQWKLRHEVLAHDFNDLCAKNNALVAVRLEWKSRALAAEAKVKEMLATERQGIRDLKNDLDSALAAARGESALRVEAELEYEAKVKELEARLTDAALVDAERQAQERARELEAAKAAAAAKAIADAEYKAKQEAARKADAERMRPEVEKVKAFADLIYDMQAPECRWSEQIESILRGAAKSIEELVA